MPFNDFFATIYELWGMAHLGDFSNNMYKEGHYVSVGLYMIGFSLILPLLYYWIVAKQDLIHWYDWAKYLVVNCLINFSIGYMHSSSELYANPGSAELMVFALINAFWSVIAFFLFSFMRKVKVGRNESPGKHTPF